MFQRFCYTREASLGICSPLAYHRKWAPKTALCFQEINSITMSSLFYLSHHFRSSHGDCLAVRGKTLDSLRMKARGKLAYTLLNFGSWVWHRKQSSEKESFQTHSFSQCHKENMFPLLSASFRNDTLTLEETFCKWNAYTVERGAVLPCWQCVPDFLGEEIASVPPIFCTKADLSPDTLRDIYGKRHFKKLSLARKKKWE